LSTETASFQTVVRVITAMFMEFMKRSSMMVTIEDGHSCGLSIANGSMPDTSPLLGPLQDNGGPTWTHAPLPGSPAIDAAKPEYCPPADQRGVARPVDGDGDGEAICEIGSYEFRQATLTTIISDQPDPSTAGEPFLVAFGVTTTVGVPAGNVIVDGGNGTCSGELVDGGGTCEITIPESGTYTLTANYSGSATYEFSHDTEVHAVLPSWVNVYLPIINRP
jgi:hypothetical protein